MLQFKETNGTLVSGIRSCYQWLPHGKIVPKCVINQENANKPICTCYLEVRHRNGLSSLFENLTFSASNVAHVLQLFTYFFKNYIFSEIFQIICDSITNAELGMEREIHVIKHNGKKTFFQWPLAIQFNNHVLTLLCTRPCAEWGRS